MDNILYTLVVTLMTLTPQGPSQYETTVTRTANLSYSTCEARKVSTHKQATKEGKNVLAICRAQ